MKAHDEMIERLAQERTEEFVIGIEMAQKVSSEATIVGTHPVDLISEARMLASERIGTEDDPGGRKMWAAHYGAKIGIYHELNKNEAAA